MRLLYVEHDVQSYRMLLLGFGQHYKFGKVNMSEYRLNMYEVCRTIVEHFKFLLNIKENKDG